MGRIPFSQVLQNASVDIRREYERLYELFALHQFIFSGNRKSTLREMCASNFINLPFRKTCISLDDFDNTFGYRFIEKPTEFDLDQLVTFCEYSFNLAVYNQGFGLQGYYMGELSEPMMFYVHQVERVIESIGYMANSQNGITDFVPKDAAAISVSEIIDPSMSYKVIEYNHHSMKGNLAQKKATLLALADKLEPQRKLLNKANPSLEKDIFYLFNTVNLRHNNTEQGSKNYKPFVSALDDKTLEKWYDESYQMCLLAFLELDHLERKVQIAQLKEAIENKEQ